MQEDPRFRNQIPDASNVVAYFRWYTARLQETLNSISEESLEGAAKLLQATHESGGRIWVGGNGGSAAIADHLCCDWTKGTHITGAPPLSTHSLASNTAFFTALANDFGYEYSFSKQVELLMRPGDLLILISSSGNSPNVLNAAKDAREKGLKTLGFTGFSGGALSKLVDVNLHAHFENYGLVEDSHQVMMHVLAQFYTLVRTAAAAKKS